MCYIPKWVISFGAYHLITKRHHSQWYAKWAYFNDSFVNERCGGRNLFVIHLATFWTKHKLYDASHFSEACS